MAPVNLKQILLGTQHCLTSQVCEMSSTKPFFAESKTLQANQTMQLRVSLLSP
jgi:hypothetical protein